MSHTIFLSTIFMAIIAILAISVAQSEPKGSAPNAAELKIARYWAAKYFVQHALPVFSFKYNGKPAGSFLSKWNIAVKSEQSDALKTEHRLTYSDPETGLKIMCTAIQFSDYPAIEWVLEFRNDGKQDTPILEDIQAADVLLFSKAEQPFTLYHAKGSDHQKDDFAPLRTDITSDHELCFTPVGGRSSDDTGFPFFNLQAKAGGAMIAIGWSGQWQARFADGSDKGVRLRAGMELTHLKLHPGEAIRTPKMMLLFWQGSDRQRGHNLLRQFILAYHTPKIDGQPVTGPLACGAGSFLFNEYTLATEHGVIGLLERYRQFKLQPEYWWIDAGWYGSMDFERGEWHTNVGNWYVRKEHFPNGLKPVSDAAKQQGMKFILWFEPERVYRGTQLFREHPEWILKGGRDKNNGILNLGHPDALKWVTDYISGMITSTGIAIYRQDFNIRPLDYWRANDAPDRQGMTEIRHIEGLYAFWDALLELHPELIIDNCASGGRRLDLETISRSIPLWRTDYNYREPNARPCHTYGLHFYLPHNGTGTHEKDIYSWRCSYSSSITFGWNLYDENYPKDQARYVFEEYQKIRPYFHGDFYPLTEYSTSESEWIGFQFHRADLNAGMVLLFRRPGCGEHSRQIRLHGLEDGASYELFFEDNAATSVRTGRELKQGQEVRILDRPGSLLMTYQRL
ncbi:alpha-galactosidase [candidate division KSB1 bacterium]|nr:alpha-galactosidase [candidate division KSB1 bacterium]